MLWWASSKASNRGVIFWLSFLLLMLPPLLPPSDCLNWVISVFYVSVMLPWRRCFHYGQAQVSLISLFFSLFLPVWGFLPPKGVWLPWFSWNTSHGRQHLSWAGFSPGSSRFLEPSASGNISVATKHGGMRSVTVLCTVQYTFYYYKLYYFYYLGRSVIGKLSFSVAFKITSLQWAGSQDWTIF